MYFIDQSVNTKNINWTFSHPEQVCLMMLHFERYGPDDGRSNSQSNIASLKLLDHDAINLLYYEH